MMRVVKDANVACGLEDRRKESREDFNLKMMEAALTENTEKKKKTENRNEGDRERERRKSQRER